jgi:hypothetical protein
VAVGIVVVFVALAVVEAAMTMLGTALLGLFAVGLPLWLLAEELFVRARWSGARRVHRVPRRLTEPREAPAAAAARAS